MKALEKKATGIYSAGYQSSNSKKFATSHDEMMVDVLDTDEDRVMYQYKSSNNNYKDRARYQNKVRG